MTRTRLAGLAAALSALAVLGCRTRESPGTDTRTAIALPAAARDAVLAEMRTMLGSLNGILVAATNSDSGSIRQAAAASGMAMAADPTLERYLPEPFLQLGTSTHMQFDSLAAAIGAGAPRDTAIARLARLTGNCVSCHAQYRLVLR
jgi:cytochrome c556